MIDTKGSADLPARLQRIQMGPVTAVIGRPAGFKHCMLYADLMQFVVHSFAAQAPPTLVLLAGESVADDYQAEAFKAGHFMDEPKPPPFALVVPVNLS